MDINRQIPKQIKDNSDFRWPTKGIKYLGIVITPTLDKLYNANYDKIINKIRQDLARWSSLPLSLLGRIESIRMNVLPRLLYPFQMLPIPIPKPIFCMLDRLISRFIWQGKRPRIRLKTLQLPKPDGGLSLPCLQLYYWAAQLKPMVAWIINDISTKWLNIEISQCEYALQQISFSNISLKSCRISILTKSTALIWREMQKTYRLPSSISSLSTIKFTPNFVPLRLDAGFKHWARYGLIYIHQLVQSNNIKSFSQIAEEFGLPNTDFFRFLQIRQFLNKQEEFAKICQSEQT